MIQTISPSTGTATMDASAIENRTLGVNVFTVTPTGALTINAIPDGLPGQEYELRVVTAGTTSYTVTLGTGFIKTGTLATGTTTAQTFTIGFTSNGSSLRECYRTAAAA